MILEIMKMKSNKEINCNLMLASNTSRLDNFYKYLLGKMAMPDIFVIGNDCKYHHGVDGKTVRRAKKNRKPGNCIKCEQRTTVQKKELKSKSEKNNAKSHKLAMDLYDEQQYKNDVFLT